ncbi:hypothetical protein [Streptomyces violaceus]|uniref:Uncharacterized protein n=1 Tax=Streptomyces violaceus TaxID=1936 RepID=A0ABY9UMF3_STRVL|nr:hypothetical protein [Streptomyces janthinus]WND24091.1 hypothetical protein RI060_43000 [Streptomyces janthinus]GGS96265.1 hypothetical protein GCM10010270_80270 [Streptomyces janthinus]
MDTADLIAQARQALTPRNGFNQPHQDQTQEATARGLIALAQAITDLNTTLADLADAQPGTPDPCQEADLLPGLTVQPAIHHSA